MYSQSKEETYAWVESIAPLQQAAKQRANQMSQRTEADGSIVLNVIVPSLHESKRIKFDDRTTVEQIKKIVYDKFNKSTQGGMQPIGKVDHFYILT
jgi:hypothetical protein